VGSGNEIAGGVFSSGGFKGCHVYVDEAEKTPRNLVPRAHVTRPLVLLPNMTSRTSGQAAKHDSKWRRAVMNFALLWRVERNFSGIGCTLDAKTTFNNSIIIVVALRSKFKKITQ